MIIKYPTGLYSHVVPRTASDRGNVTFTISSTDPPRTSLLFPKLPPGVGLRRRDRPTLDQAARRRDLGQLLYTVNSVGRSSTATSVKQYEVGQVLEFGGVDQLRTLDQNTAGSATEIRHDTGVIDYDRLGISREQREAVEAAGDSSYASREAELAAARQLYSDLQVEIAENQKMLVEAGKALDALVAMGDQGPVIASLVSELRDKKSVLNSRRGVIINRANDTSRLAAELLSQLRDISQVVR